MQIQQMSDDYFVSGQILAEHIPALAEHGIKSVICNRPDGEVAGQPAWAEIEAAAIAAGMGVRNIPITHGALGLKEINAHEEAVANLPAPILAYCNSGTRSAALYGIVNDSL